MKRFLLFFVFFIILITLFFSINYLFNNKTNVTNADTNILNTDNTNDEHILSTETSYDSLKSTDISNVTMSIKEGTLTKTGATVIITDANEIPYIAYGFDYTIEKKYNNDWVKLELLPDANSDPSYNENAIIMGEDRKLEMDLDWSKLYGELNSGKYRIVKKQSQTDENTKQVKYDYFWVEFDIK